MDEGRNYQKIKQWNILNGVSGSLRLQVINLKNKIMTAKELVAKRFPNSVRIYEEYESVFSRVEMIEMMEAYAKQQAMDFAEWIVVEEFEKYVDNGKSWWRRFNEYEDYSIEELYNLWKSQ